MAPPWQKTRVSSPSCTNQYFHNNIASNGYNVKAVIPGHYWTLQFKQLYEVFSIPSTQKCVLLVLCVRSCVRPDHTDFWCRCSAGDPGCSAAATAATHRAAVSGTLCPRQIFFGTIKHILSYLILSCLYLDRVCHPKGVVTFLDWVGKCLCTLLEI